VISFHAVVRVLLQDMSRARDEVVEHSRVDRCQVGRDLNRRRSRLERADEERPCSRAIAAFADQDVDDLPVLIHRAVQVGPPAGDLDVGLIDRPSFARRVPRRARGWLPLPAGR
jgi:hypothetical protein